jgi:hypothetical protein
VVLCTSFSNFFYFGFLNFELPLIIVYFKILEKAIKSVASTDSVTDSNIETKSSETSGINLFNMNLFL